VPWALPPAPYDRMRNDPVSRALRDDYVAFNLAAISRVMLHTTALAFGDQSLAELIRTQLHNLTPLIMHLTRIIPHVVVQELSDEDDVPEILPQAADLAVENAEKAWRD
jgi:hypothetical protein